MKNAVQSSVVVLIVSMLMSSIAMAGNRQTELENAREQKESNLEALNEEALLLNETLEIIRDYNPVDQTPAQISSFESFLKAELESLVSGFKNHFAYPAKNG